MGRRSVESVNRKEYEALLKLLRKAREDKGLSQGEVARRLGVPQPRMSAIESGERRLDLIEFMDIAKVVGFDASEFIRKLQQSQ